MSKSILSAGYWRAASRLTTRKLTMMAILTAMQIVLARVTAISVGQWLRISFGFLPTAMAGMLMGPVASMLVAGVADMLGTVLTGQSILIGLTVTTVFDGLVYGLLLWDRRLTIPRAALAMLPMAVISSMLLNSIILAQAGYIGVGDGSDWPQALAGFVAWYSSIGGAVPKWISFCNRVIKAAVQYPVNVALLFTVGRLVDRLPASLKRV